jgi:hypothetical protein
VHVEAQADSAHDQDDQDETAEETAETKTNDAKLEGTTDATEVTTVLSKTKMDTRRMPREQKYMIKQTACIKHSEHET